MAFLSTEIVVASLMHVTVPTTVLCLPPVEAGLLAPALLLGPTASSATFLEPGTNLVAVLSALPTAFSLFAENVGAELAQFVV